MSNPAVESIQQSLPDAVLASYVDRSGDSWAVIRPSGIAAVAKLLKEQLGFRLFLSMDAVDRLHLPPEEQRPRFEVLYFFRNIQLGEVARCKVQVEDGQSIPTISNIFQGASWAERFVWDFYGVVFEGGIQRRLLMYPEFVGHALRKDYPLRGRQGLIPERPIADIIRGPGTNAPHTETPSSRTKNA